MKHFDKGSEDSYLPTPQDPSQQRSESNGPESDRQQSTTHSCDMADPNPEKEADPCVSQRTGADMHVKPRDDPYEEEGADTAYPRHDSVGAVLEHDPCPKGARQQPDRERAYLQMLRKKIRGQSSDDFQVESTWSHFDSKNRHFESDSWQKGKGASLPGKGPDIIQSSRHERTQIV